VQQQLKANKVRAIAITSRTRKEILPDVPTVAEAGLPRIRGGILGRHNAPAGTPKEVITQLEDWFGSAARTPEFKAALAAQTYAPVGVCGSEFVSFIRKGLDEYGRIVREANIKAE